VHVAFALSVAAMPRPSRLASACLCGASIAIPGGFFLGGLTPHGGDPGPGIVVLTLGVALLVCAIVAAARALRERP
jgi:hypothetical protein